MGVTIDREAGTIELEINVNSLKDIREAIEMLENLRVGEYPSDVCTNIADWAQLRVPCHQLKEREMCPQTCPMNGMWVIQHRRYYPPVNNARDKTSPRKGKKNGETRKNGGLSDTPKSCSGSAPRNNKRRSSRRF